MASKNNIDFILSRWKYDPDNVTARLVETDDGRYVIQMRVDLGILQMEIEGRPDGQKVDGMDSWLDRLGIEAISDPEFFITEEQKFEIDREFSQYYYRRICWLSLHEFDQAVLDADHTLMLMDFIRTYSDEPNWILHHEQYRPFVIFQRTEAMALSALEEDQPENSVAEINQGLAELQQILQERREDSDAVEEIAELTNELRELRSWVQSHYMLTATLQQQLDEAIEQERYELAAELRDRIRERVKSQGQGV